MQQKQIAVLLSGGLDSAVLIDFLSKRFNVQPIYVRKGHLWEPVEISWLRKFLRVTAKKGKIKPLAVLNLTAQDLYKNHWSLTGKKVPSARSHDRNVYLPGKNLLLISKAAVFCALHKIPNLALGPLKSNPFPDARAEFFKMMEKTIKKGLKINLKIHVPFLKRSKTQVMARGAHLPLHLTFSCLSPIGTRHCGRCNKCAERKKAFRLARITDRTRYAY